MKYVAEGTGEFVYIAGWVYFRCVYTRHIQSLSWRRWSQPRDYYQIRGLSKINSLRLHWTELCPFVLPGGLIMGAQLACSRLALATTRLERMYYLVHC